MSAALQIDDLIALLRRKTRAERHAIAALLAPDAALPVLRWLAGRADLDRATAAMIFWRLRSVPAPAGVALAGRGEVLAALVEGFNSGRFAAGSIGWDGIEPVERRGLIGAEPVEGLPDLAALPEGLFGPFEGRAPEAAAFALFDTDHIANDFEDLWRFSPALALAANWFARQSPERWALAAADLEGRHLDAIFAWMIAQPECTAGVAARIFAMLDICGTAETLLRGAGPRRTGEAATICAIVARWRAGGYAPDGLAAPACRNAYEAMLARYPGRADPLDMPADLLDGTAGNEPAAANLYADFDYYCLAVQRGATSRAAAVQACAEAAAAEARRLERPTAISVEQKRRRAGMIFNGLLALAVLFRAFDRS